MDVVRTVGKKKIFQNNKKIKYYSYIVLNYNKNSFKLNSMFFDYIKKI